MIERPLRSLSAIVGLTVGLLVLTIAAGATPLLGLDLQGGVEVVLEPVDTPENLELATTENLDLAVEILRNRVDAIGVAEPDITTQSGDENFIIVQLPGIENQDAAVALVGQTAVLEFRPVLFDVVDVLRGNVQFPEAEVFGPEITNGGPGVMDLQAGVVSDPNNTPSDQSAIFLTPDDDAGNPGTPVLVGPTEFTGSALDGAEPQFINGGWLVEVTFKSGAEGLDRFNQVARRCFGGDVTCPFQRLAFVLDGVVESAPTINSPEFTDRRVVIQRDNGFPEEEARNQALVLEFGALPLAFADPADPEAGLVRTVSASLGRDSLEAGIIAGIVGLAIVAMYMLWYYRLLGLAALLSLTVSASLLYVTVAWLSERQGLALTLAGVVGLIVSIGVSLDSNVVFFEDLKEHFRKPGGVESLAVSMKESFPRAFSTVFWANLATLIGAVILYVLTVGSVRGFALMLGLASILDLVATWFFMGPFVRLMVNRAGDRPALFGVRTTGDVSESAEATEVAVTT